MNKWEEFLTVGEISYQKDWGDHPQTGDWTVGWTVFFIATNERATKRRYSSHIDARRGAAMIFRSYMKRIEKELLGD